MSAYTVKEVIKLLQESYDPDEQIVITWWDKSLPYLSDLEVPDWVWNEAMNTFDDMDFDISNSIVWDLIAEKMTNAIKQRAGL